MSTKLPEVARISIHLAEVPEALVLVFASYEGAVKARDAILAGLNGEALTARDDYDWQVSFPSHALRALNLMRMG